MTEISASETGDKRFTARWKAIDCTIPLYAVVDGVVEDAPFYQITAKYDTQLKLALAAVPSEVLSRAHYIQGSSYYAGSGEPVPSNALMQTYDKLYVLYASEIYTVLFDSDGGSYVPAQSVVYNHLAERPAAPQYPGHEFLGWYDEDGNAFDFRTPITANVLLSARWQFLPFLFDNDDVSTRDLPFSDVLKRDWFYGSVRSAWSKGLINGVTATEYRPNETLTVAQAIKLSAVLYQLDHDGRVTLTGGKPWYSSYLQFAVENGILEKRYSALSAEQLNAPVSRAEFAHILYGALDSYREINTVRAQAIPDVKMQDAYADEIYAFYRAGILTGSDAAGTFHPEQNIRRSEVAAILARMYTPSERLSITLN